MTSSARYRFPHSFLEEELIRFNRQKRAEMSEKENTILRKDLLERKKVMAELREAYDELRKVYLQLKDIAIEQDKTITKLNKLLEKKVTRLKLV